MKKSVFADEITSCPVRKTSINIKEYINIGEKITKIKIIN